MAGLHGLIERATTPGFAAEKYITSGEVLLTVGFFLVVGVSVPGSYAFGTPVDLMRMLKQPMMLLNPRNMSL